MQNAAAGMVASGVLGLGRIGFWALAGTTIAVVGGSDPAPGVLGGCGYAIAGLALGLVCGISAPIGAGTAMLVAGVQPTIVWWWALPAVAGWILYVAAILLAGYGRGGLVGRTGYAPPRSDFFVLNLYRALLDRWVYRESALPWNNPLGMRLSGEPGVRLAEVLGLSVLAVPLYAFLLSRGRVGLEPLLWLIVLGYMHVRFFRDTADLSRYRRQEVRMSALAWLLSIWLLSAGTPGAVAAKILGAPRTDALWSLMWLCAAALILLAAFGLQTRMFHRIALGWFKRPRARVRFGFASAYGVVLGVAWFAVLAWLAHGQGPIPLAVSSFIVLQLAGYLVVKRWVVNRLHQFDAVIYTRSSGQARVDLRNTWAYDVYVSPKAPPNYRLVRSLAKLGVDFVQGQPLLPTTGHYAEMVAGRLNQKEAAAAWVRDALKLLDYRGAPYSDYSPHDRLWRRYHYMSRALCYDALGRIHRFTGYLEDASASYLRAAAMCRRVNAMNAAAIMLVNAQLMLDATPDDVLVELERALSEPGVVPVLRKRLIVLVAAARHRAGNRIGAAQLLESASALLSRFHISSQEAGQEKVLVREPQQQVVVIVGGVVWTGFYSEEDDVIIEQGMPYLDARPITAEPFPVIRSVQEGVLDVPRRRRILHGLRDAEGLRPGRGVFRLNWAISVLERRSVYALSVELREYLGLRLVDADPAQALHHIGNAMDIREASRHRIVADHRRAAVGGRFEHLYDAAVAILARHGDVVASRLTDPVTTTALWFAEAARSRSLVDLLGETTRYPIPDELQHLLRLRSRARRLRKPLARGPRRGDPSRHGAEQWSFDSYRQAEEEVRAFVAEATQRGIPEEQLTALADEAEARQRYRKAKRLMRPNDPATLAVVRQARDELERCLEQLQHAGGTAAQYASVRLGAPVEYAEIRELLRRN